MSEPIYYCEFSTPLILTFFPKERKILLRICCGWMIWIQKQTYLNIACILSFAGIWIEKGMGMIIPGFIPTPLGEIVEYSLTVPEILITTGVWAFSGLIASCLLHLAIPIISGDLRHTAVDERRPQTQA